MINFSYTTSPFLNNELKKVDKIRDLALLSQISPKIEHRLRFEVLVERSITSVRFRSREINARDIQNTFITHRRENLFSYEKLALRYKSAYDSIYQGWVLNTDLINISDILNIYANFHERLPISQAEIKSMLSFLQVHPEHAIIQAGIAYAIFYYLFGQTDEATVISLLICYMFLYKNGYDFRGLLNLEEYFFEHKMEFFEITRSSYSNNNLSAYLDHFIVALTSQADKAYKKLSQQQINTQYPKSYFELSERQKEILTLFDRPDAKISNRLVQKLHKISQITASRDLAKLASLGLIYTKGKGRSIHYTKF